MTKINRNFDAKKLLAITLSMLLIPVTGFNIQANAQTVTGEEDPHTAATGTLEIKTKVIDGYLYMKQTYTSNDLHQKYGFDQISRERIIQLPENYTGPMDETQVKTNVKMKVIHESETAKLQKHLNLKNNGLPMNGYEKWDVVVPDSTATTTQTVSLELVTHVQNWASKSAGGVFTLSDPISVIWDDTANASTDVLNALVGRMNGNGWGALSACTSTDLYIPIAGTMTKQTTHEYKYITGLCDQYHVRLWRLTADRAIGAAHQEFLSLGGIFDIRHIGGANIWEDNVLLGHVVTSWENAETQVSNAFGLTGGTTCWTKSTNSHSLSNSYTREYWNMERTIKQYSATNNGLASQINQVSC